MRDKQYSNSKHLQALAKMWAVLAGVCQSRAYKCRPSQHVPSELPHTPTLSTGQVVSMATLKVMPAMATVNGTTFTQIF
ncbi:hypothetical protein EB796_007739 [Bugula neritina]|uniref:Uncharacterized protein n=1 Tax=Bugula neritina TaxID=10212 RepID=A0A7J7K5P2_BUGNE|nr:hypothetical protein EB796_007739 [Bugula neritina]